MARFATSARAALVGACLLMAAVPAAAQVNFSGEWSGRYHEDQPDRVPGEEPGDFSGIPLNDAARMFGDSYDVGRHSVLEEQCAPYTLPYMFFGPNQFRIWQQVNPDTQELVAIVTCDNRLPWRIQCSTTVVRSLAGTPLRRK